MNIHTKYKFQCIFTNTEIQKYPWWQSGNHKQIKWPHVHSAIHIQFLYILIKCNYRLSANYKKIAKFCVSNFFYFFLFTVLFPLQKVRPCYVIKSHSTASREPHSCDVAHWPAETITARSRTLHTCLPTMPCGLSPCFKKIWSIHESHCELDRWADRFTIPAAQHPSPSISINQTKSPAQLHTQKHTSRSKW